MRARGSVHQCDFHLSSTSCRVGFAAGDGDQCLCFWTTPRSFIFMAGWGGMFVLSLLYLIHTSFPFGKRVGLLSYCFCNKTRDNRKELVEGAVWLRALNAVPHTGQWPGAFIENKTEENRSLVKIIAAPTGAILAATPGQQCSGGTRAKK